MVKSMKFYSIAIGILFVMSTFARAENSLAPPEVETLSNGLKIAWFLNDRIPVVDVGILVQAGYRDDAVGKSGTAELIGELLDRGAGGMSAQELSASIESVGGSHYCSTSDDSFNVGVHGLTSDAKLLLDVLAKMVLHPDFPENEVNRGRVRLIDRWNHFEDYSDAIVNLTYQKMVTAGTSYGRGNMISENELKGVMRSDIVNYYKTYFVPQNAILTVVGKVDKEVFRQWVTVEFGNWKSSAISASLERSESPGTVAIGRPRVRSNYTWKNLNRKGSNPAIIIVNRPNLAQAQIRMGSPSLSIHAPEHYALRVANSILGELFNSRLNSSIRDKLGLSYAINSSFTFYQSFADLAVSTGTQNETVGPLIRKVLEVLKDFRENPTSAPITSKEVEAAKEYLIGGFALANSSLNAVAGRWIIGEFFNLGPDYLNAFVPKIRQVTLKDVGDAVAKAYDPAQIVVVIAGNPELIQKSLSSVGLTSIKQVSASDLK